MFQVFSYSCECPFEAEDILPELWSHLHWSCKVIWVGRNLWQASSHISCSELVHLAGVLQWTCYSGNAVGLRSPLQKHSQLNWTQTWTTCSGWPCLTRSAELGNLSKSFPTSTILWFFEDHAHGYQVFAACEWKSSVLITGNNPMGDYLGKLNSAGK